jgi:hypothetical protein
VSNVPVVTNHKLAGKGITPNTGEWLLLHKQYQEWRSSNESKILWLHRIRKFLITHSPAIRVLISAFIAGAGKTKLVSKVVDDLTSRLDDKSSNNEALAYFYCDRNEEQRRDPETYFAAS